MRLAALVATAAAIASCAAFAQALTPSQLELHDVYRQLVEIDTSDATGSCTAAAEAMAARLVSSGLPQGDVRVIVPPENARKGNLLARLRGKGERKPLLLLAHIDVVAANPQGWKRDPFKLFEEAGYFYGRGTADDKAMAAIFVENLMRYRREGLRPDRDLLLALTCDEEIIPSSLNGVQYLLKNRLLDAELALNEGGGGLLDSDGRPVRLSIQAAEKVLQNYRIEASGRGGHSAQPRKDNAITRLSAALVRIGQHEFPFKLLPVTRSYFARMSEILGGQTAQDMKAILGEPPDPAALARLSQNPGYNAQLRTTCVATLASAGEAANALPQHAEALVNCRILPGESPDEVRSALEGAAADSEVRITPIGQAALSSAPPLSDEVLQPVRRIAAELWPGVPLVPAMSAGATDGAFLNAAGISTYGISGLFNSAETSGVHGTDERLPVRSLYDSQEFLYRLAKELAGG